MEQQERFFPKGKATDVFDRGAAKRFQTDLYNLALDKDVAKKRNLLYMALLALCVVAMVFVVTTANFKTYVVRVDNATGQVEAGGELKATNYDPQEAEVRAFLVQFIRDTRTVPLDPVQYKTSWEHAQHFLTQEAANKLNAILQTDNPASKFGRATVQPTIRSIQAQPGSPATYQVRWVEDALLSEMRAFRSEEDIDDLSPEAWAEYKSKVFLLLSYEPFLKLIGRGKI